MPAVTRSRREYLARIHRVQDHIEQNLATKLELEELARVAHFSPFHFHRLFHAVVGETLYQFIQRLRLERAAHALLYQPDASVTEVAIDVGFSSPSTFARAFKRTYGVSATEWRDGASDELLRKNRKTFSKLSKAVEGSDGQIPRVGDTNPDEENPMTRAAAVETSKLPPAGEPRITTLDPWTIAYVRHVGAYAGNDELFGELFNKLMAYAGPRELIRFPETKMLTVYHDNPDITDTDKLRISVGMTVPEGTAGAGEVATLVLPGGKYALVRYEIDSDQFGQAWEWVYGQWLPDSGYQPDDRPALELYHNDPDQHPERKHILDIAVPLKPL